MPPIDQTAPGSRRRGDAITAAVLALPEHCYRCGAPTRSIVGFLVPPRLTDDPEGFIEFEILAPLLVRRLTSAQLAHRGVGPIKKRRSRLRPEGYLSNGCINCDAIQGWFPLHEDLMEFLSEGGTYTDLTIARWSVRECELRRGAHQPGCCSVLDGEWRPPRRARATMRPCSRYAWAQRST